MNSLEAQKSFHQLQRTFFVFDTHNCECDVSIFLWDNRSRLWSSLWIRVHNHHRCEVKLLTTIDPSNSYTMIYFSQTQLFHNLILYCTFLVLIPPHTSSQENRKSDGTKRIDSFILEYDLSSAYYFSNISQKVRYSRIKHNMTPHYPQLSQIRTINTRIGCINLLDLHSRLKTDILINLDAPGESRDIARKPPCLALHISRYNLQTPLSYFSCSHFRCWTHSYDL